MGTILLIAAILLIAIPLEAWSTLEVSRRARRRILLGKKESLEWEWQAA